MCYQYRVDFCMALSTGGTLYVDLDSIFDHRDRDRIQSTTWTKTVNTKRKTFGTNTI